MVLYSLLSPAPVREGRGSRTTPTTFTGALKGRHELLASASSASTASNVKRARKLLTSYANLHGALEPVHVTKDSSILILNLLAEYCKFGTEQSLRNDAMGALIQRLRILYHENGHYQSWSVDDNTSQAKGNPLVSNPDVSSLRRAHRVHLSRYGTISLKARPVTATQICEHAEKFWFGCGSNVDARDIQLHAILVLGLNLGLRFD